MKLFPKWLRWIILIFASISLILVVISFWATPPYASDFFLLALLNIVCVFVVIFFWRVSSLVNVHYGNDVVLKKWGNIVYKKIPYSRIKGASLECAVCYRYNIPFCDQNKRAMATLVLYDSDVSFVASVYSDSCFPVHSTARMNTLCSDFLNVEFLKILLDKTCILIYITEQVLLLHKEDMVELLEQYPQRFVVAFCDRTDKKEKKHSYDLFSSKMGDGSVS